MQVANTHTNSMVNIELEPELNSGNAASSTAASCHTRVTAKCARVLVDKLDDNSQLVLMTMDEKERRKRLCTLLREFCTKESVEWTTNPSYYTAVMEEHLSAIMADRNGHMPPPGSSVMSCRTSAVGPRTRLVDRAKEISANSNALRVIGMEFANAMSWEMAFGLREMNATDRRKWVERLVRREWKDRKLEVNKAVGGLVRRVEERIMTRCRWKMTSDSVRTCILSAQRSPVSHRIVSQLIGRLIAGHRGDSKRVSLKLLKREWNDRIRNKGLSDPHCWGHIRTVWQRLAHLHRIGTTAQCDLMSDQRPCRTDEERSVVNEYSCVDNGNKLEEGERDASNTQDPLQVERVVRPKLMIENYNVGSLKAHILELVDLVFPSTSIIALQETRIGDEERLAELPMGWTLINHPRVDMVRGGGVGVLFRSNLIIRPVPGKGCRGNGNGVEWIWVRIGLHSPTFLASVYSPPIGRYACPRFWEEVTELLPQGRVVICGDLNWNALASSISSRGRYWQRRWKAFDLRCVNDHQPTHFQNGRGTMIDFAVVSSDVNATNCVVVPTSWDHFGIRFEIDLQPGECIHEAHVDRVAFHRIRVDALRDQFTIRMNERCDEVANEGRIDNVEAFVNDMKEVAKEAFGGRMDGSARRRKFEGLPYWCGSLSRLIALKRNVRRRIGRAVRDRNWCRWRRLKERANALTSELRREVWRRRNEYYRELKQRASAMHCIPGEMYWWLKCTNAKSKGRSAIPFSAEEMNAAWRGVICVPPGIDETVDWETVNGHLQWWTRRNLLMTAEVSTEELRSVLASLPNRKAPGLDDVPYEAFKPLYGHSIERLRRIVQDLLHSGEIPDDWKRARVCLIPKTTPVVNNPLDYRPIALLPSVAKVVETLLWRRIKRWIHEEKPDLIHTLQGGFMQKRGCMEQAWILQQIVDEKYRDRRPLYVAFLDIKKAYDSVPHSRIMIRLIEKGVDPCISHFIYHWIQHHRRILTVSDNQTELEVSRGVPQGSILSPFLFNVFIDDLVNALERSGDGLVIDDVYCGCLLYADDIALIAQSPDELNAMVHRCEQWSDCNGVEFSSVKSKWMRMGYVRANGNAEECRPTIGGNALEEVDQFTYLGIVFQSARTRVARLDNRKKIKASADTLQSRQTVLHPGYGMPIGVGLTLVRSVLWTPVQYGMELGFPYWKESEKLEHECLRAALGAYRSTSVTKMMSFTGWMPVRSLSAMRLVRFALRLIRSPYPSVRFFAQRVIGQSVIVSQWLKAVRESAERLECIEEWDVFERLVRDREMETEEFGESVMRLHRKLVDVKRQHQCHPSIRYGGTNAVFSFLFYSGRFNPADVEHRGEMVDCYLCGAVGGDHPRHIISCPDDRASSVVTAAAAKLEMPVDAVKNLLLFTEEWRVRRGMVPIGWLSRQQCVDLTAAHCQLYRLRKAARDGQMRHPVANE